MDAAWSAGINFFDTAASYGGGRSEAWVGRWREDRRADVLVSTKVYWSASGDPTDFGLSASRIRREIRASLERLRVPRVDMYLTHEPDPATPILETLGALDELVRAGTVRAIGASNLTGEQLEEALQTSAEHGLARLEWVQNEYSLLTRESEHDVLPICAREGLGFTPFSPLAGGWLAGRYRRGEPFPAGSRMALRPEGYDAFVTERTFDGLERFASAAADRGVDSATLAFAWVLSRPEVTSALVGPRRPKHLRPAIEAVELELTSDKRAELAELFA